MNPLIAAILTVGLKLPNLRTTFFGIFFMRLFYVRPIFSTPNSLNRSAAHGESRCQIGRIYNTFICFNENHSGVGQFSMRAKLSEWFSSFSHHILNVLFLSTKEEMRRSDANSDIAFVANANSFWNGTIVNLPRNTVNKSSRSIESHNSILAFGASGSLTRPKPALRSFINKSKETRCGVPVTLLRTKKEVANRLTPRLKNFSAGGTLVLHMESLVSCAKRPVATTTRSHFVYSDSFPEKGQQCLNA